MNKIMLALLVGFMAVVSVRAEGYEGNPDKIPSIGLNLGGSSESGDSTLKSAGTFASQNMDVTTGHLVLDLRLPVSNSVTLSAAVGSLTTKVTAEETPLLFGNDSKTNGYDFEVGIRFYIH